MPRPALTYALAVAAVLASSLPSMSAASRLPQGETQGALSAAPAVSASIEELTTRGDELRAEKKFAAALDYYGAALAKNPDSASLHNRIGIVEMSLGEWNHSIRHYKLAIKADPAYAEAYNNLGVDYYFLKKTKKAIKLYQEAIRLHDQEACYYSNLGAAYFSRKEFQKSAEAYTRALQLDPDVLEENARTGVANLLPSPEDRARFDYAIARLYARMGASDHSLEHLRRAIEEGYKHINDVYKDEDFAILRKDPRFVQLMTKPPAALPE